MINLPTDTRRNSCTACTFIRNGVKTRKAIPHTCGQSDEQIMKIIKEGKNLKIDNPVKVTCYKCECVFEYVKSDIKSDFRDGEYVVCPNETCKSFISTKA